MMFLRIKALYHRQYFVQGFVAFLGLFELTMNGFLLTRGVAVVHNKESGVHGVFSTLTFWNNSSYLVLKSLHDDLRSVDVSFCSTNFQKSTCFWRFLREYSSVLASSSAWLPLLYDTVVLALTLNRTLPQLKNKKGSYVMKRLFQDGLIYYTCVYFLVWSVQKVNLFLCSNIKCYLCGYCRFDFHDRLGTTRP